MERPSERARVPSGEDALPHPSLDDSAQHRDELLAAREHFVRETLVHARRNAGEELRLAREAWIVGQVERRFDVGAELRAGFLASGDRRFQASHRRRIRAREELEEELVLPGMKSVEGARGDAGLAQDVVDPSRCVAAPKKDASRCSQKRRVFALSACSHRHQAGHVARHGAIGAARLSHRVDRHQPMRVLDPGPNENDIFKG